MEGPSAGGEDLMGELNRERAEVLMSAVAEEDVGLLEKGSVLALTGESAETRDPPTATRAYPNHPHFNQSTLLECKGEPKVRVLYLNKSEHSIKPLHQQCITLEHSSVCSNLVNCDLSMLGLPGVAQKNNQTIKIVEGEMNES